MKKNILFLLLSMFIFTGCALTKPDVPHYTITKTDKIGYLVDIKNKNVEHEHLGTTIFNNFGKTYYSNWEIEEQSSKLIKEKIKTELVDLSKHNITLEDLNELIVASDKKWIVNKRELYNKFVNEMGLKAIITITDGPTSVFLYPINIPINGSGLVSHHFLGMKRYFSVLSANSNIYLLNPVGKIDIRPNINYTIIYDPLISSFEETSGFVPPSDIENITKEEFSPAKKMNSGLLNIFVTKISEKIR